jgi:hypothetical protein
VHNGKSAPRSLRNRRTAVAHRGGVPAGMQWFTKFLGRGPGAVKFRRRLATITAMKLALEAQSSRLDAIILSMSVP